MESIARIYLEETEDMLQNAEECLIRLEKEYSAADANEMFRIAHTIKGSSHMAGYKDIGDIMHKMEDLLDCVRKGSVQFDRQVASLCFEGLDIVKKMLECGCRQDSREIIDDLAQNALRYAKTVEAVIGADDKGREKAADVAPAAGIVASLLNKKPGGQNKYYISFFIEEDAPMVSPVFLMIFKSVENIGTLLYSSISDGYFSEGSDDSEARTLDIILCTDVEESELYTYFSLNYVERINIVDLTRSKLMGNDYYVNSDDTSYVIILGVFIKLYNMLFSRSNAIRTGGKAGKELRTIELLRCEAANAFAKMKDNEKISSFVKDFNEFLDLVAGVYEENPGAEKMHLSEIRARMVNLLERANNYMKDRHIFRLFKPEKNGFIDRLCNFTEMINKSTTVIVFIDLSRLKTLYESEVKALIEIKREMEADGIEVGIIAEGPCARRIINIFDCIKPVEDFCLYKSELDGILGLLHSKDSIQRIIKKVKIHTDEQ